MMPYQCFALRSPIYGPAMRLIASITNASQAAVTTTFAHGYVDGTVVRFDIPPSLGMPQIDQMTSNIVVTGPTTFLTAINSTLFQPFVIPMGLSPHIDVCGLIIPIGSDNDTLAPAVVNLLNPQI